MQLANYHLTRSNMHYMITIYNGHDSSRHQGGSCTTWTQPEVFSMYGKHCNMNIIIALLHPILLVNITSNIDIHRYNACFNLSFCILQLQLTAMPCYQFYSKFAEKILLISINQHCNEASGAWHFTEGMQIGRRILSRQQNLTLNDMKLIYP